MRHEQRRWRTSIPLVCVTDLGVYIPAHVSAQVEPACGHLTIAGYISAQQNLAACKDQILTDRTSLLPLKPITRPHDIPADTGFVTHEKDRACHADGTCHFTIDRDGLGGGHQVTVHFAVDGHGLPKDDQIAVDRSI